MTGLQVRGRNGSDQWSLGRYQTPNGSQQTASKNRLKRLRWKSTDNLPQGRHASPES